MGPEKYPRNQNPVPWFYAARQQARLRAVPRPNLSLEVIQNNAFTNFFEVIVTDTVSKTDSLFVTVQSQRISLDTVASYTYVGHYSFENPGTYSFYVKAWGVVGDTTITRSLNM